MMGQTVLKALALLYVLGAFFSAIDLGRALEKGEVVERHGLGYCLVQLVERIVFAILFWLMAHSC